MKFFIPIGVSFYCIGMVCIGIQQAIYSEFLPVLIPKWPSWIQGSATWATLSGILLVIAAAIILFGKKNPGMAIILGGFLLALFILFHLPYQLFVNPYSNHLGAWANTNKIVALSGGVLIIAGSFSKEQRSMLTKPFSSRTLHLFVLAGTLFFSQMLILFGIDHFLYAKAIATIVPAWIPGHLFWTYFAGVALIASGIAIILKFKTMAIGILLGSMIFLWLVLLHLPRALADPDGNKGNEVTSLFQALAFSGIAFVIAGLPKMTAKNTA